MCGLPLLLLLLLAPKELELELIQTQMASGNARALRKQSKCGMIQEGEGYWPNSSENLQKARYLWVMRTPQNNEKEGAQAKKLATCGHADMRNTAYHRQRPKFAFQRGRRLLLCPRAIRGFDGTGTPSSFAEWQ